MDSRRLLPLAIGLTVCVVLVMLVLVAQRPPPRAASSTQRPPDAGPREVVAAWDARRSAAWARGDLAALRGLYVAGSPTGRADVRMLAAYVERGLHVDGLATQVLALEVIAVSPGELELQVTDRVVGGVVAGRERTVRLPRDRASTRTLVLRRVGRAWRMVTVRDQPSAAASTSRTSTSWKS